MEIRIEYMERVEPPLADPRWRQTFGVLACVDLPEGGRRYCETWLELSLRTVRDTTPHPNAPTEWEIWIDNPTRARVYFEPIRILPGDGPAAQLAFSQAKQKAEEFLRDRFLSEMAAEVEQAITRP